VLVINKAGANTRKQVLFINGDREYREGKAQNSLRPEDVEKISQVYRTRRTLEKYSRLVSLEELEKEDFNLNIRRYVDNSPPPEPQDVRAHLHGGIPVAEIDQLAEFFANYEGVNELLFKHRDARYSDFVSTIRAKDGIKTAIDGFTQLEFSLQIPFRQHEDRLKPELHASLTLNYTHQFLCSSSQNS
jgi:type I restriction enzyme M protein